MLSTTGLIVGYDDKAVATIDDISLSAGQAALLLGPSGSGKTTLLLTLAGLLPRLSGDLTIAGVDPQIGSARLRDRFRGTTIGFIFQELNLVRGLTVLENVLLAPYACGIVQDKKHAKSLLERLKLGHYLGTPASQLSRGQAQRVALARALILKPKLLIADEPTASLDDEACSDVANLLVETALETSAALLIATHDSRLKAVIGHQIAVRPPS